MEYSALDIINNFNNLKGRRAVLNKQLEDVAMYAAPAKYGTMFDSKEGSSKQEGAKERPVYIVSDFAQEAANTFTRGLFSNLHPLGFLLRRLRRGNPSGCPTTTPWSVVLLPMPAGTIFLRSTSIPARVR